MLSSRYLRRFVPGIGARSLPWGSTQASATWAAVHPVGAGHGVDDLDQRQVGIEIVAHEAGLSLGGKSPLVESVAPKRRVPVRNPRPSGL